MKTEISLSAGLVYVEQLPMFIRFVKALTDRRAKLAERMREGW